MGIGKTIRQGQTDKVLLKREQSVSQSATTPIGRFAAYRDNHATVAKESLQRLINAPMASLMTWLVIGIALALPTGFYVAIGNIDTIGKGWDGSAQISLYLHRGVTEQDALDLAQTLQKRNDVGKTHHISKADALEEFRSLSGYGEVLESLDSNPLPTVIIVQPQNSEHPQKAKISSAQAETLLHELQKLPLVDQAQLDLEWVQRMYAIMRLGQQLTAAVSVLLALGVLLVIGNTIRLAIENRRDEIIIVKLVGGADAFVRRPFLYTGFWYGLGGGLIAWLIIALALTLLSGSVSELVGLYQSEFKLQGLNLVDTIGLWVTGSVLGLLGAWLAVMRHLDEIEPQ